MANTDYQLDRAAKQSRPAVRNGLKRLLPVAIAIGAAIAIMYGETWAIERAPISTVACGIAHTADIKRALDDAAAGLGRASSTDEL